MNTTSVEHGQNMFYPYTLLVFFMRIPCIEAKKELLTKIYLYGERALNDSKSRGFVRKFLATKTPQQKIEVKFIFC